MINMANRLGEKALQALLGRTVAGACVAPDFCYCKNGIVYAFNCFGTCANTYRSCH